MDPSTSNMALYAVDTPANLRAVLFGDHYNTAHHRGDDVFDFSMGSSLPNDAFPLLSPVRSEIFEDIHHGVQGAHPQPNHHQNYISSMAAPQLATDEHLATMMPAGAVGVVQDERGTHYIMRHDGDYASSPEGEGGPTDAGQTPTLTRLKPPTPIQTHHDALAPVQRLPVQQRPHDTSSASSPSIDASPMHNHNHDQNQQQFQHYFQHAHGAAYEGGGVRSLLRPMRSRMADGQPGQDAPPARERTPSEVFADRMFYQPLLQRARWKRQTAAYLAATEPQTRRLTKEEQQRAVYRLYDKDIARVQDAAYRREMLLNLAAPEGRTIDTEDEVALVQRLYFKQKDRTREVSRDLDLKYLEPLGKQLTLSKDKQTNLNQRLFYEQKERAEKMDKLLKEKYLGKD